MKSKVLSITILVFSFTCGITLSADKLPSPFVIIPQPHEIAMLKGSGLQQGTLQHIFLKGDFKTPVMGDILSRMTIVKSAGEGTLTLILDKTIKSLPSDEGYILTISGKKAEITAKGEAGLFYGCQSLEQLLEDSRDYSKPVPCVQDF